MSNEHYREERVKRFDSLIETNEQIIQDLETAAVKSRDNRKKLLARMDRRQAEIERLRIENNRLLDILFNQRNQEDNPN